MPNDLTPLYAQLSALAARHGASKLVLFVRIHLHTVSLDTPYRFATSLQVNSLSILSPPFPRGRRPE